nr:phosphoribosyltransferase family protein [Isoptericola halotolerans]
MRRAGTWVAPAVRAAVGGSPVAVVPAPSAPSSRLRRGREPVRVLARAVADGLRAGDVRATVVPALRRRGATRDQVGLGARARGRNLAASLVVRRGAAVAGTPCLLVDDVLTTGATLAAAELALARAGAAVLGALVLAATPPPDSVTESPHAGPSPAVHPDDTLGLV